jgi:RNase P subunit RPR2
VNYQLAQQYLRMAVAQREAAAAMAYRAPAAARHSRAVMRDHALRMKDHLPPPTMRVVCAWCGTLIGRTECMAHQRHHVSHGICFGCAKARLGVELDQSSFTVPPVLRLSCAVSSATPRRDGALSVRQD